MGFFPLTPGGETRHVRAGEDNVGIIHVLVGANSEAVHNVSTARKNILSYLAQGYPCCRPRSRSGSRKCTLEEGASREQRCKATPVSAVSGVLPLIHTSQGTIEKSRHCADHCPFGHCSSRARR